jgi:excisionase family DNA binding protein
MQNQSNDRLMTPGEVAAYFAVNGKTISRYVKVGKLPVARRTPGGHARFWESDVIAAGQPEGGAR